MKSERELESVGTTTIPRLDNNASGIVLIIFLTKMISNYFLKTGKK